MLAICHKSLRSILSPCDVYLWDPMTYVSRVPVGCHFVLVDPSSSDQWDLTAPFSISIWPMGPDGLHVTCTYRTLLHLHLTYGTQWLVDPSPSDLWDPMAYVSHVPVGPFSISIWPMGPNGLRGTCCHRGLINSNSKKHWDLGVEPRT
jgi:hypothetical protein